MIIMTMRTEWFHQVKKHNYLHNVYTEPVACDNIFLCMYEEHHLLLTSR